MEILANFITSQRHLLLEKQYW